jgi:glycosyltransferase involved in cell wall biosynthesis
MSHPRVRVFLCTYRRNDLLPRALKSLCEQTFSDWVCELHNDDPEDPFPAQLVREVGDPRIETKTHARNLGGVGTFNLMFEGCPEDYVSLLEDDNWWEPEFLERMVKAMDGDPRVAVGWSNMRFWQEEVDGKWTRLDRTVWPTGEGSPVELFDWPEPRQTDTALHSTGAMLVRTGDRASFKTPLETSFEFVDPVRERAFPHPLLFVREPLVNFALTRTTARSLSAAGRAEHYVLLISSFFKHVGASPDLVSSTWQRARKAGARSTNKLIFAGLASRHCRPLLAQATAGDWLYFAVWCLRHPRLAVCALRARSLYPDLWSYLDLCTAERCGQKDSSGCS